MNGESVERPDKVSKYQQEFVAGPVNDCVRVSMWKLTGAGLTWKEFFQVKGEDFKGEEDALGLRRANVAPVLPKEAGSVPLEDVDDLTWGRCVLNFEDYLLHTVDQLPTKPPKVMVPPAGWSESCRNLIGLGSIFPKSMRTRVTEGKCSYSLTESLESAGKSQLMV